MISNESSTTWLRAEGAGPVAAGQRSLLHVVRLEVKVEEALSWLLPKEADSLRRGRPLFIQHPAEELFDAVVLRLELGGIDRRVGRACGERRNVDIWLNVTSGWLTLAKLDLLFLNVAQDMLGHNLDGVLLQGRSVRGLYSLRLGRRLLGFGRCLALGNYLLVVAAEMFADVVIDLGRAGIGRPDLGQHKTFEVLVLPGKVIDEVEDAVDTGRELVAKGSFAIGNPTRKLLSDQLRLLGVERLRQELGRIFLGSWHVKLEIENKND